jgi:hypothetical protein
VERGPRSLEAEALATGTWSTLPPPWDRGPEQPTVGHAPARQAKVVGALVAKYVALGLAVGAVVAGGGYQLSSGIGGARGSQVLATEHAEAQKPADLPASPATAAAEAPLEGARGLLPSPADPPTFSTPPLSRPRPAVRDATVPRLPVWTSAAAIRSEPRGAARPSTGASRRREPLLVYRLGPGGVPTAEYLDIVTTDDPVALASLAEEVARFNRARRALERGDAKMVLEELGGDGAMGSNYVLETEAWVLRIEALLLQGDRTQAARLAGFVLARHPDGPLTARMRGIVGGEIR